MRDISRAPPDPVLASRSSRLLARGLDYLIDFGAVGVAIVLVALAPEAGRGALVVLACAALVLVIVPIQLFLLATRGQSIGKRLLGIRVVDAWGAHPGWARVILVREGARLALGVVPGFGLVASLVDTLLIFRRDARTLHDEAAGTYVVDVDG